MLLFKFFHSLHFCCIRLGITTITGFAHINHLLRGQTVSVLVTAPVPYQNQVPLVHTELSRAQPKPRQMFHTDVILTVKRLQ